MTAPRDDTLYVDHIRAAIARIQSYLQGVTEEEFLASPLIQDAVIRQIQIIGEAAKRLSPDFQARQSAVPWKDVMGMRDKLVHDYMGVDLGAVWDTAKKDIVILESHLEQLGTPGSRSDEP